AVSTRAGGAVPATGSVPISPLGLPAAVCVSGAPDEGRPRERAATDAGTPRPGRPTPSAVRPGLHLVSHALARPEDATDARLRGPGAGARHGRYGRAPRYRGPARGEVRRGLSESEGSAPAGGGRTVDLGRTVADPLRPLRRHSVLRHGSNSCPRGR